MRGVSSTYCQVSSVAEEAGLRLPWLQTLKTGFLVMRLIQATLFISKVQGTRQNTSELSVVWDSQFVTSFTSYMYTDCLDHRDYNLHVHVFENDILEFKYPLTELLICHTNFEKAATEIKECWLLLTSKNAVKQCSITKVTKAPLHTLRV